MDRCVRPLLGFEFDDLFVPGLVVFVGDAEVVISLCAFVYVHFAVDIEVSVFQ